MTLQAECAGMRQGIFGHLRAFLGAFLLWYDMSICFRGLGSGASKALMRD